MQDVSDKKSYLCSLYQLTNCKTVRNFEVLPREICLAQDTSSLNGRTTTATLHMTSALDTSSTTTTPLASGTISLNFWQTTRYRIEKPSLTELRQWFQ